MRIISHLSVRVLNERPGLKNDLHFKYDKIFYIKVLWYELSITVLIYGSLEVFNNPW